jgi:hypothetical protein
VPVQEEEKDFIHNRLALTLRLAKSGQNDKSHLKHIITDFRVLVVPHGQMLHHFRTALAKIKVKIKETDRIKLGNVEVIFFALLRKISYNHAKVVESPPYEMLLLLNLNFHYEPGASGIFAIYIEYGVAVKPCFAKLLAIHNADILNGVSQLLSKKCVEQEHKRFRALLVSKGFFESEVQSKRSELRMFNVAGFASFTHGHNTSFKGDKVNGPRILYKKIGSYAVCNSLNIEKFDVATKTMKKNLTAPLGQGETK